MEFQIFNKTNALSQRNTKEANISILKSGAIHINAKAMELTGISKTMRCEFLKSTDGDWYICNESNANSLNVRGKDNGSGVLNCRFVGLALNTDKDKSIRFLLSHNPVKYDYRNLYLIITINPITNAITTK